jgi:hypothetical protein
VSGTWRPKRTSNRAFPDDKYAIAYYSEAGEQRVIEAQRIGAQQSVPVDFRGDAGLVDGRAVDQAIDRVVRDMNAFLGREDFVADAEGLAVEVVVRVAGRAWPAVPGITTPQDDEAVS